MISIYVHIPWCLSKCDYCDFYSVPRAGEDAPHGRYCAVLLKQFAADVRRHGLSEKGLASVYFGGGTPSLMPPDFYEKMLWAMGTTLVMQSDIEVTVEVNPATVDATWFRRMVDAGVTRFSIGVQSFSNAQLKRLGRLHSADDARRAVADAREAHAASISIDLMYGLPGEKIGDVERDLAMAMELHVPHISAYQLTPEASTPLAKSLKHERGRGSLPSDDAVLSQLQLVRRTLGEAGWHPYEISNFAVRGHACRHNLHYWRYGDYLGLGCGAVSFICAHELQEKRAEFAKRWMIARDVDAYLKGRIERVDAERISRRTAMGEFCFLGLRTAEGVSLNEFERRFDTSFDHVFPRVLDRLIDDGLIQLDDRRAALTERGVELSNVVFRSFVE